MFRRPDDDEVEIPSQIRVVEGAVAGGRKGSSEKNNLNLSENSSRKNREILRILGLLYQMKL